ncbi:MAG: tetratricopeptide repeat protein [Bacteroidia bacterium]|nr:tetratricopeptide repeat protein [Bacteroidia bacterium]
MKTRRHCIVLCIVVWGVFVPAGSAFCQKAILDSLERVVASRSVRDTLRAAALIDLCYAYLNSGSTKALKVAREASEIAAESGNKRMKIRCAIALANAESQRKNNEASRKHIDDALASAELLHDDQLIAASLNALSNLHRGTGEDAKALVCSQRALSYLEKTGDTRGVCQTLYNIGQIHSKLENPEKAMEALRRCKETGERIGFKEAVVRATTAMGSVYSKTHEFDKALACYSQAITLYTEMRNPYGVAFSYGSLGWVHHELGNHPEAITALDRAITDYEKLGDKTNLAVNVLAKGRVLYRMGRYDEAEEALQRALQLKRSIGDRRGAAALLSYLGNIPLVRNQLKQARALFSESLDSCRATGDRQGEQMALLNLGIVEDKQGNYKRAIEYYRESLQISRELKDPTGIAKCFNNIAKIHLTQGRLGQALEYFNQSLELARKEQLHDEAMILNNIGAIHTAQGRIDVALACYEKSLSIAERREDRRIMVSVLQNLVRLLSEQGRFDEAKEYNDQSLKLSRQMEDRRGIAAAYANHANFLSRAGRHDEALRYANMSLELADEAMDVQAQGIATHQKGIIYTNMGQFAPAREYLTRSLTLREGSEDAEGTALSFLDIASLDVKLGRIDDARKNCERARDIARQSGYVVILKNAMRMLSDLSALAGRYDTAYEQYQRYTALKDSLLNESNARHLAELQERYEREKNQTTIALLQKEKEVQDLEIIKSRDALKLQELLAERENQRNQALRFELDLAEHEKNRAWADAEMRKEINLRRAEENERMKIESENSKLSAENARFTRNALIVGLALVLALAVMFVNRFRQKQKLSELRAKEAEFQGPAATMQAMAVSLEAERKERAMQQEFARRLLSSQEEERARIARELHDSLSQGLIVVKNRAMMGMRNVDNKEKLIAQLEAISEAATESLTDVRQISRDLRPHQLDQLGITEALRSMIQNLTATTEMTLDLDFDSIDDRFSRDDEIAIFRIVQEAMNNIHKHAGASHVAVHLRNEDNEVRIFIRDNGVGFDVNSATRGFGIQGMGERVRILGGRMTIDSRKGEGSTITLTIPRDGNSNVITNLGILKRRQQDGMRAV